MQKRIRLIAAVAGCLLLFYSIIGFLVVPAVAKSQAIGQLQDLYGLELEIGKLGFNPYTLIAKADAVALKAEDGERLLAFTQLTLDLQWRSLFERAIVLRSIDLVEPFVHVHIFEDGRLNLAEAFASEADTAAAAPTDEETAGIPVLVVESILMSRGELRFTDDQDGRGFDQRFTPLDLQMQHFTTRPAEAADLSRFLIELAAGGRIEVSGDLAAIPAAFALSVHASDLSLPVVQPYVPAALAAELAAGRLSFDIDIRYGQATQSALLSVGGSAAIDALKVVISGRDEPVLAWERVALSGIALELAPDSLVIDEIAIDGLDSSFRIYSDGDTNIGKVLRTATESETEADVAAVASEEGQDDGIAFPFMVHRIVVDGSTLLYRDELIRPPVSVRIDELGGAFTGLASAPDARLEASIDGVVGSHGRADIAGAAMLFAPAPDLDATVSFSNIELTDFSPYAGRFAGYEILQGKLYLDLRYTLAGTRIKGENRALFDQFELGNRVESEDAIRLPLKLALSLLRDRQGRIEITLPVEGDINDPEFRIGPLVWQAFVNVLTKIVTAPFSFIASVFGGGPDMEFAVYVPGSAVLVAAERDKFKPLASAMTERPRLLLEIQGAADPLQDRDALRQRKYAELIATAPTLAEVYEGQFGAGSVAALREEVAAAAAAGNEDEAGPPEVASAPPPDPDALLEEEMGRRLLAAQVVDDEELVALALARGQQVMEVLVRDGAVEAGRIFVRRGEIAKAGEGLRTRLILEAR